MKYYPLFKSAEQIIREVGFVPSSPRGWEKSIESLSRKNHKNGDRLHGFTHAGYIDIHYDRVVDGKHVTKSHHAFVRKQIEQCAKVDVAALEMQIFEVVGVQDAVTKAAPGTPLYEFIKQRYGQEGTRLH